MTKTVLSVLLAVAPAFIGCSDEPDVIGGSGLIEARDVLVSAEASGRVVEMRFDEGSVVGAGDTLLVIDTTRLKLEIAAALAGRGVAEARLRSARVELQKAKETEGFLQREVERVRRLVNSNTATQKELDRIEYEHAVAVTGLEAAETGITTLKAELTRIDADLDRLKRQLEDCFPSAPQSGVVLDQYVEQGELLGPGRPVARIANLDTVTVEIYLPAGDFATVTLGDQAQVDTEAGGTSYKGTIIWTSDEAEFTPQNVQTKQARANLVYAVKVRIPNTDKKLKDGMPVFVTIGKR